MRKLGQQTEFGEQLDSIADYGNFCILPAVFVYALSAQTRGTALLILPFIVAGTMRLALYNIKGLEHEDGGGYYTGIPTTVVSLWIFILIAFTGYFALKLQLYVLPALMPVAALLMISYIRYKKAGWDMKLLAVVVLVSVILVLRT